MADMNRTPFALPFAAMLTLFTAGCPFNGECFPDETVVVTVDEAFDASPGKVVAVSVDDFSDGDVTGVDDKGIPQGAAEGTHEVATIDPTTRSGSVTFFGSIAETYFYAFIDLNDNGALDAGEPFGVASGNPSDQGCDDLTVQVRIDSTY